jgi:arsenate reductase (thioredoxin)
MSTHNPQTVLFVCTGNSCRSQMAEALLRAREPGWTVLSAGLEAHGVHPMTLQVLSEHGVDTSPLRSKTLFELIGNVQPNVVITVCAHAEKNCPLVWPGKSERLYWPFDDPASARGTEQQILSEFRRVRTMIDLRIADWLADPEVIASRH